MRKQVSVNERNKEVVTFFYMIFGHRIHQGMDQDEARKQAYDAVSLRYGITKGTLTNIISAVKNSRNVNYSAFRGNVIALIDDLRAVNEQLERQKHDMIIRNERLISILQECLEDESR